MAGMLREDMLNEVEERGTVVVLEIKVLQTQGLVSKVQTARER